MGVRHRRGHHARAAAFVDDHLPLVWRYAAGMLGDPAAAHEVTRSVLGAVDPPLLDEDDRAALRRLLLVRARRAVAGAAARGPGTLHGPATAVPAALRRGFAALDDADREALVLLDVVGVDVDEAAALCEVSAAEVRQRRHRAHRRLVHHVVGTAP